MGDFWTPVGGGGTDDDAIHDNVAGEIAAITEKVSPVSGDLILIEDSAASNAKKRVQVGNLPGGGGSTWTDYSGTFAWTARTTNPTIGNGAIDAWYAQHDKTVVFMVKIIMGSTTTFGSGVWSISLPVAPALNEIWEPIGSGVLLDSSPGTTRPCTGAWIPTVGVDIIGVNGQVSPTVPWTWANGDALSLGGVYRGV